MTARRLAIVLGSFVAAVLVGAAAGLAWVAHVLDTDAEGERD